MTEFSFLGELTLEVDVFVFQESFMKHLWFFFFFLWLFLDDRTSVALGFAQFHSKVYNKNKTMSYMFMTPVISSLVFLLYFQADQLTEEQIAGKPICMLVLYTCPELTSVPMMKVMY